MYKNSLLPTPTSSAKETWFYVRDGAKFERRDVTAESSKLKASKDVDPELRAALTDAESGLMIAGSLPQVPVHNAAGNKALLDSLEKANRFGIRNHKKCYIMLLSGPNPNDYRAHTVPYFFKP